MASPASPATSPYQPAVGFWRQSPQHMILWALTGVLHRVERDIPEQADVAKWESKLQKAIYQSVKKYRWEKLWTAKHLRKKKGDKTPPPVPDAVAAAWDDIVKQITDDLWLDAGKTATGNLDLPFNPDDLQAGLDSTMDQVRGIPDTLRKRLQSVMRDAYDQAKGPQGFARMIRSEFADISAQRASLIARTEWSRAASTATLEGYRKQGVEQKVWITMGDNRVCANCEMNAADGAIPIDALFYSDDDSPPQHAGCRCSVSAA